MEGETIWENSNRGKSSARGIAKTIVDDAVQDISALDGAT
jgi:hypothetical protein